MTLDRCPWFIAGPLLGLVIVGLRAALNKPFGALGGFIDVAQHVTGTGRAGFSAIMLAGIVLGGFLFSTATGTFALTTMYDASNSPLPATGVWQLAGLVLAGGLIGAGARMAGGCTSGHGLCGVSLGSRASVIATMTFFATAVVLAQLFAWITRSNQ